ncbi:NAD(P)/FAD-dependent oxidoreductase [Rhodococcus fascians]|nr:NAD(P)/FAD-dependent oxidoreductase [Rhodococcus fascians]MBY4237426.1 NAD(P)/FAD-dependent oxidoreductase [Rhodococcus fascians]MBY4253105.1 NAD(P)/FAD-dependent oxidoreductase [Rhodococcus fascians]MBY4268655.1 NAD(P)/FAD-dependent oxidoreductase [Rhodococcus fascians]
MPGTAHPPVRQVEVAVIGGGLSGIGMAVALRRRGIENFVVLDRGDDVGGTWRDNTYPGAACDVPSHLYSFSFDHNPDWTHSFSTQEEIQQYILGVSVRHRVRNKFLFDHELVAAEWDERAMRWMLTTTRGRISARVVVSAVGVLCERNMPNIEGLDRFAGPLFHSSDWDHSVELEHKRVAVIGTGASAIQIVPAVASTVDHLYVYQRTAPWVFPKLLRRYSRLERAAFRRIPPLHRLFRAALYLLREIYAIVLVKLPSATLPLGAIAAVKLRIEVRDRSLRARVSPRYRAGCKRMLISNDYYPALGRDNVDLVTSGIAAVQQNSIVTTDGEVHSVDAIVVATGFHVTDSPAFDLFRGRDDQTLAQAYAERGIAAYKGTTVAGFPNLFVILGPNSATGYSSTIYMIESQIAYIVDAVAAIEKQQIASVEVRQEVQDRYNRDLQHRMRRSVWVSGGCRSWFLDSTGRNVTLWPDFSFRFRKQLRGFDIESYDVVQRAEPLEVSASATPISRH